MVFSQLIDRFTPRANRNAAVRPAAAGTTSALYGYDALGRKTAESVDYGPFTQNHSATYRADGQKVSYTGPDNSTVTYTYDAFDRLTNINLPGGGLWERPVKGI